MLIDDKPLHQTESVALPPPYTGPSSAGTSALAHEPYKAAAPAPDARRCNQFVAIVSYEKITGSYIVDPTLQLPESLLAPLDADGTPRPNLKLYSSYAKVGADIWVLDDPAPESKPPKKTTISLGSSSGSVSVKLHALGNLPCSVSIKTDYGWAKVALPHDYVGIVTIRRSHASPPKISPRIQQISDIDGEMKCFVGDMHLIGPDGWNGHTVNLDVPYGRTTIDFVNDQSSKAASSSWSWGSLFGGGN